MNQKFEILPSLVRDVADLDILSSCGDQAGISYIFPTKKVLTITDADRCFNDAWIFTKERINEMIGDELGKNYQQFVAGVWNYMVLSAKESVNVSQGEAIKQVVKRMDLHRVFAEGIFSDLVRYLVVGSYREKGAELPSFYENLFLVYKTGRLPCGWSGDWPSGHLIVY